ncbi:MAG: AAA family ATPase [Luteitalea sp.]|nr:AAA family ATPase [Luteitalea sp.]
MYEAFFGLRERPFDLGVNPRFIFLPPRHREAWSLLRCGISPPSGLTLLLGEAGTGKTTLMRAALAEEPRPENQTVLLSNPTLTRAEFYEFIARGFGLSESAATSKARFLDEFQRAVHARHAAGGLTTMIIDEAQSLPDELLEEVRLLANIETSMVKLLNLVLVGHAALADRLNEPSLRQLKQRITLRWRLAPLDLRETAVYLASRIRVAGGNATEIFTREAVVSIYEASGGLPRTINVIGDNALLGGFAAQVRPVNQAIVREICDDFDLDSTQAVDPRAPASQPRGDSNADPRRSPAREAGTGSDRVDRSAQPVTVPERRGDDALGTTTFGQDVRKRRFLSFLKRQR